MFDKRLVPSGASKERWQSIDQIICRSSIVSIATIAIVLSIVALAPSLMGMNFADAELGPVYFTSIFGLTPFYPGSNRILSVDALISSLSGGITQAIWIQLIFNIAVWSTGVASFLTVYARRISWPIVLMVAAILTLSMQRFYQVAVSPAHPEVLPLGGALLVVSLVQVGSSIAVRALCTVIAILIIIVVAGVNPTFSLAASIFLFLSIVPVFLQIVADLGIRPVSVVSKFFMEAPRQILVGSCAFVAVLVWIVLQGLFGKLFPQAMLSNYSVESYGHVKFDISNWTTTFKYFVEGLVGQDASLSRRFILQFGVLGTLPLACGALLMARLRRRELTGAAFHAICLAMAVLITSGVISQNAHILLVEGPVRARYFLGLFCALAIAFSMSVAVGLSAVLPKAFDRLVTTISAPISILAGTALLAFGIWHGGLSRNLIAQYPDSAELKDRLANQHAVGLIGDYWLVWPRQLALNDGASRLAPVVPVTIRTEALQLESFRSWEEALWKNDSFVVGCIRYVGNSSLDSTPPGDCEEKAAFNRDRGAFPSGVLTRVGEPMALPGGISLSILELGRTAGRAQPACSRGAVILRGSARDGGADIAAFELRDGGFALIGVPPLGKAEWRVSIGSRNVTIAAGEQLRINVDGRRVSIQTDDCRVLVDSDTGPFLATSGLDIRVTRGGTGPAH